MRMVPSSPYDTGSQAEKRIFQRLRAQSLTPRFEPEAKEQLESLAPVRCWSRLSPTGGSLRRRRLAPSARVAYDPAMHSDLAPGMFVRHPDREDWGLGQVQSVDGDRVTVNFENAGKHLINAAVIRLTAVDEMSFDRAAQKDVRSPT